MTNEEIKVLMKRIKFCIARQIPVGEYIPEELGLQHVKNEWLYTVLMHERRNQNTTVTIGFNDAEWPAEGDSYTCKKATEETIVLTRKVKFCMAHKISVELRSEEYIPTKLRLRYVESEWLYMVDMCEKNNKKPLITIGLADAEWPTEGGGYICRK